MSKCDMSEGEAPSVAAPAAARGKSGLSDEAVGRWFMFRLAGRWGLARNTRRRDAALWYCLKERHIDRDREAVQPYNDNPGPGLRDAIEMR